MVKEYNDFFEILEVKYKKNRFEVVMVVVVAEVVDNKLVKEFNGGLVKFYLSKENKSSLRWWCMG